MKTETFESGAVRDTQVGKLRYDLISPVFLKSLARVMTQGAEKYGERNWEKGLPRDRTVASLLRHVIAIWEGDTNEDHIGHAAANLMFLKHLGQDSNDEENCIQTGR